MLYAVICTDRPNSLALRMANRPEHVAYLQSLGDRLAIAGPFTEPDGKTMNGSLIVIEAGSLQAAKEIAAGDPFARAGLGCNGHCAFSWPIVPHVIAKKPSNSIVF